MDATVVIKVVDVGPDVVFGMRVIGVPFLVDPFAFQASEETLHRCVIPAIPLPAHALNDAVCLHFVHEMRAGVLASLIRVEHPPRRWTSLVARLLPSPDD